MRIIKKIQWNESHGITRLNFSRNIQRIGNNQGSICLSWNLLACRWQIWLRNSSEWTSRFWLVGAGQTPEQQRPAARESRSAAAAAPSVRLWGLWGPQAAAAAAEQARAAAEAQEPPVLARVSKLRRRLAQAHWRRLPWPQWPWPAAAAAGSTCTRVARGLDRRQQRQGARARASREAHRRWRGPQAPAGVQ